MNFSVNTIYSAKDFLSLVSSTDMTTDNFLSSFKKYKYDLATNVLKLVTECGWVNVEANGQIMLTKRGQKLNSLKYKSALAYQLEDMILIYNPEWGSFLPKGRSETIRFLPEEPKQCFKEAGFLGEFNSDLVGIWDRLALAYRNYGNELKLKTGRTGEELTIEYEYKRTGNKPVWQSVESNLSGFDIVSVIERGKKEKLLIEVKSSTSKRAYAKLFISKNEWRTALLSKNYKFYLWLLGETPKLFIVDVATVACHIADNKGDGEWESISIPFSALIID